MTDLLKFNMADAKENVFFFACVLFNNENDKTNRF